MPKRPSDPELKKEFSLRIKELLAKGIPARKIAVVLGMTPQSIYNYRDGRVAPSPEIIRKAMEKWQIQLVYRGRVLSLSDFGAKPAVSHKRAIQYELWEAIKKLDSQSVRVDILERQASSVRLGVRIAFRRR